MKLYSAKVLKDCKTGKPVMLPHGNTKSMRVASKAATASAQNLLSRVALLGMCQINDMSAAQLEKLVLVHRYRYYVLAKPIISDMKYDQLEKRAREICAKHSRVHLPGSDNSSHYPQAVKTMAKRLN
jgi:hypothetical protein